MMRLTVSACLAIALIALSLVPPAASARASVRAGSTLRPVPGAETGFLKSDGLHYVAFGLTDRHFMAPRLSIAPIEVVNAVTGSRRVFPPSKCGEQKSLGVGGTSEPAFLNPVSLDDGRFLQECEPWPNHGTTDGSYESRDRNCHQPDLPRKPPRRTR
jgi:hypothetical protein